MNFLKIRKARQELKEVLRYAKHVRHMHEDVADPEKLKQLHTLEQAARNVRKGRAGDQMEAAGEVVIQACETMVPPRKHPKIGENVEVLFVAIAAAMAIRAYFLQPFKIPTGSMQPTLYGITARPLEPGESTAAPARFVKMLFKGEAVLQAVGPFDRVAKRLFIGTGYTICAKADGVIPVRMTSHGMDLDYRDNFDGGKTITIHIGNVPHSLPRAMGSYCRYGESIRAGESILKGVVKAGDYILVNRMKYNFMRPQRGDITVFDAQDVSRNDYYIKRMVGLPGETISVNPPYLLVNGEKTTEPRFNKIFTQPNYNGYQLAHPTTPPPLIGKLNDSITLSNNQYLFFGDNTDNSLDGRYFGPVKEKRILGSAFFICLPFDRAGWKETYQNN